MCIRDRNTDRLLVLVNQLLDFRKIESKVFTLSLKVKSINSIVINTYNRFMPAARQRLSLIHIYNLFAHGEFINTLCIILLTRS